MTGLADSLRQTLRTLGVANGAAYVLAQGLHRLSGARLRIVKYVLLVQPLAETARRAGQRGGGVAVREIDADDPLIRRMQHPQETLAARFRQGARCLAAERDGRLVGYLWWIENRYQEDEVRCEFVPAPARETVWDFDVYVDPDYRGSLVFARLWQVASRELLARGFRYSASRISAFNTSSLLAHERLGARVVGQRWYLCAGALQLSLARGAPRCHGSWSRAPVVVVAPPVVLWETRR